MNRRSLLGLALLAPSLNLPTAGSYFRRLSTIEGDPGEAAVKLLHSNGIWPRVLLNGEHEEWAVTVDVGQGMVKRAMQDAEGHPIVDGDAVRLETVFGRVEIDFGTSRIG
jgi:hypothetical protein